MGTLTELQNEKNKILSAISKAASEGQAGTVLAESEKLEKIENLISRHKQITSELEVEGLALAEKIVHNAPEALARIKKLAGEIAFKPIEETIIRKTAQAIASSRVSAEGQEGLKAFLEKRPARWLTIGS